MCGSSQQSNIGQSNMADVYQNDLKVFLASVDEDRDEECDIIFASLVCFAS